jgi:hypothetical protein
MLFPALTDFEARITKIVAQKGYESAKASLAKIMAAAKRRR